MLLDGQALNAGTQLTEMYMERYIAGMQLR
nr:MAG TPA: hypothetical protein [Bacteriophage sp.]